MIRSIVAILIALLATTSAVAQNDIESWQPKAFPISYEIWDVHHNIIGFGKSIPDSIMIANGQVLLLYFDREIMNYDDCDGANLYFGFNDRADLGNIRLSWWIGTLSTPWYREGENREYIGRIFTGGNLIRQANNYIPVTVPIVGLCQTKPPNEWFGTLPLYVQPGIGFSGTIHLRWWKR
jgi:hypothetical protein